jgi:hypothetical protein
MSSGTIPGYGQEQPSEKAAIQALSELVGPVVSEAIWSAAVQTAHLSRPVTQIDDLEKVADELTKISNNLARVGGRSLKIRLLSYKALAKKVAA